MLVTGSTDFPSLLARIKAATIDAIIILIIFSLSFLLIDRLGDPPNWIRGMIFIFFIYLYEPIMVSFLGGTIGHQVVGLKIMRRDQWNKKLNLLQASSRFIVKYLLNWLSFITVTGSKNKSAIHDMVSGSIVLYK